MKRNRRMFFAKIPLVSLWFAILVIVVAVVSVILSGGPVRGMFHTITQYAMTPVRYTSDAIGNFFSGGKDETILNLQEEVSTLEGDLNRLTFLREENEFLREQLDILPSEAYSQAISARIIGQKPLSLSKIMIINKGAVDGVALEQPVIAGGQMIGVITAVEPSLSEMTLITDPGVHVHAYLQDSDVFGLTSGQLGSTSLLLEEINKDYSMNVGDLVFASGRNNGLWEGLVLGEIVEIQIDDRFIYQSAIVKPIIVIQDVNQVLILSD